MAKVKVGDWVRIDKFARSYLPKDRPYSILEALFSYTCDRNEKREMSINGYARIWSWSRCKVRRFVQDLEQKGEHIPDKSQDSSKTGARQKIRLIIGKIVEEQDSSETVARL